MATRTATVSQTAAITAPPSAMNRVERTRQYKDFLTPALHRRFTHAAAQLFGLCYLYALIISPPRLVWIWNPISFTGVRAILLSGTWLCVFIARIQSLQVGKLNMTSEAETWWQYITSLRLVYTIGWYLCSASFFVEVYLWMPPERAHLGWVDAGTVYERPRLNENPIFLRSLLLCLAGAQAMVHLARDYDTVTLSSKKSLDDDTSSQVESTSRLPKSLQHVADQLPTIAGRVARLVVPGYALALPIYFLLIRRNVWPYFYTIGRIFFRELPPTARPTGLDHTVQLTWQALSASTLLALLWELSNVIFTFHVSQPPLRRQQPLTSEVKDAQGLVLNPSKAPNKSLLGGLQSKKEIVKGFAMWELWLLCDQYPQRRKTIYTDVGKTQGISDTTNGSSIWEQISGCCMGEISAIADRITSAQQPPTTPRNAIADESQQWQQQGANGLPNIASRSLQEGNITVGSRSDLAKNFGNMVKAIGQSPGAYNPVAPNAVRAIEWGADRLLTKEERVRLSPQGMINEANSSLMTLLRTPLGAPFRRTFARMVDAVVFGGPQSNHTNIIYASKSLASLCTHSLREDDYGQVAKSIAAIVRNYTATIVAVQAFVRDSNPSWTDVGFGEPQARKVPEVQSLLSELKQDLEEVLLAFGEYADSVGLTRKELREAREVVGKPQEMRNL